MPHPQTNCISLNDLIQTTRERLSPLFPPEEVSALVYWLCKYALGYQKLQVLTQRNDLLTDTEKWWKAVSLITQNYPVQYIEQQAPFFGMELVVDSRVLIPRPETEELVDWMLKTLPESENPLRVLDMGTGSGCIALALSQNRPQWHVTGCDVDHNALEVAEINKKRLQSTVTFLIYDMLSGQPFPDPAARPAPSFDVIVSNPPYITSSQKAEMSPRVWKYEPTLALFPNGEDPLIFYRYLARFAQSHLSTDGYLFLEINECLMEETQMILRQTGFSRIEGRKDINDKWRMIRAQQ